MPIGSTLEVPSRRMVRNVTIHFACWWQGVAGTTCTAIHISEPPPPSGKVKNKKRGPTPGFKQPEDCQLLGASFILRCEEEKGGEVQKTKEGQEASSR